MKVTLLMPYMYVSHKHETEHDIMQGEHDLMYIVHL